VPEEGPAGQGVASVKVDYSPALMLKETVAFIDRHRDEPFFLYLSYTLPHANNEAFRKTGDGTAVPDYGAYKDKPWTPQNKGQAAMIGYLDDMVGQVMQRLQDHGLIDHTVVFFTSDNGPHNESGNDVSFFDANGPVTGIKRAVYDGGIRAPMIVQWPGRVSPGTTTNVVAGAVDVMATLADISGAPLNTSTDGISLLPTLLGHEDQQQKHKYLYWEFYEQGSKQALRMGNWKAVCRPLGSRNIELYDLSVDVAEEHDLAAQRPELTQQLAKLLAEAHTPAEQWRPRGKPRSRDAERSDAR